MKDKKTIRSLLPADHWFAIYNHDTGQRFERPLVAWALVEGEDGTEVMGVVAGKDPFTEFANETGGFDRYVRSYPRHG